MKQVAYYKGCLASLSAKELDTSTQALAPKVGLELLDLETVTCCGAGDIHEAEPDYYLHLNARILAYAGATGSDTLMTICNVCTLVPAGRPDAEGRRRAARAREREPRGGRGAALQRRGRGEALPLARRGRGGFRAPEGVGAQRHGRDQDRAVLRLPDLAAVQAARVRGRTSRGRSSASSRRAAARSSTIRRRSSAAASRSSRRARTPRSVSSSSRSSRRSSAAPTRSPCPLCHLSLDAWQSKLNAQRTKEGQER